VLPYFGNYFISIFGIAAVSKRISETPIFFNFFATSVTVAPVVVTSSTKIIFLPLILSIFLIVKAFLIFSFRSIAESFVCVEVYRLRFTILFPILILVIWEIPFAM